MTMRTKLLRWPLMIVMLSMAMLTACGEDPIDQPTPEDTQPTVTIDQNSIAAKADGGSFTVGYTLSNGFDGIEPAGICEADWVQNIVVESGTISFDIAANTTTETRESTIEIKYPNSSNTPTITITQEAADNSGFEFTVSDLTSTSCSTNVKPANTTMAYIVYMAEVSYFAEMGIDSAEKLFEDDYDYFTGLAHQYESNVEQFMLMNAMAFIGESNIQWTGMRANREYILYAYGITFNEDGSDYSMSTPISYTSITLPENKLAHVDFDVEIAVNGPEVDYKFSPINWDGAYYIDIYSENDFMYREEGSLPSEEYTTLIVETWLARIEMYMSSGYAAEDLMNMMCLYGSDSYSEIREADTNYMMVFYAIDIIDGIPQVISEPYVEYFRTGIVEQSDMKIDIKAENVYARVADISVTPSAEDPYALALVLKSDIPQGDNSEIINWLTGSFGLSTFKGNVVSHLNTLDPETEYSILAFGYHGGVVTTDLFRLDIKTEAEGICENSILNIEHCGPYSPLELSNAIPDFFFSRDMATMYEQMGYYMMWIEVTTEEPTPDIFCAHYDIDKFGALGHDGLFDAVTSYNTTRIQAVAGMTGVQFVICGVVMDYRGNYSDMWLSEPFSYDYNATTKRPIDELIEKLNSDTRSGRLVLVDGNHRDKTNFLFIE